MVATVSAAVALLSRLPVRARQPGPTGAAAFPIVGALLAIGAAVPIVVFAPRDAPIAAILAIGLLALLDGALHLDGLADSADGLAAADAASADRARTDPRVGPVGASVLILVIVLDVTCLGLVAAADRGLAVASFIAAVAAARGVVALATPWLPRREAGLGAWFSAGTSKPAAALAGLGTGAVAVVTAAFARSTTPIATALVTCFAAIGALLILGRVQRGATGDAFGAAIEIGVAAGLGTAALLRP
jgi:adenosylcobinamide-GDP ribazoletransferase